MIGTVLLLAVACTAPPMYQTGGAPCSDAQLAVACGECSQIVEWSPVPGADYYQVQRCLDTVCWIVGNTGTFNHISYEGMNMVQERNITYWLPAWDCTDGSCTFPIEGFDYRYSYRPMTFATHAPAADWSPTVQSVAIPYACYSGGVEVKCNAVDELLH